MDYRHTCDTIYTHFQGISNNIYGFWRPFFPSFFTYPPIYFYLSIFVFTRPNDEWTGLYIKLLTELNCDFVQVTHLKTIKSTMKKITWAKAPLNGYFQIDGAL